MIINQVIVIFSSLAKQVSPFKKLPILVCFACFVCAPGQAQTKKVDSLRQVYYTSVNKEQQLQTLFALCDQVNSINLDSLNLYTAKAFSLASSTNNRLGQIQTAFYRATYFTKTSKLPVAAAIIDSAINVLNKKEDVPLRYRFLILKTNILVRSDKQKEAINNGLELLHAAEQSNDYLTQIRAKIGIGWAYMEIEQYRNALNWFLDAVAMEKTIAMEKRQPSLYSNIAAVYNNLYKNDSAEIFCKLAIELAKKKDDLTFQANAYFIYAGIYSDGSSQAKSEQLLEEGLRIRRLIGDPFYIVSDIFQIGSFYATIHETDKGIALLKEGIAMAHQNNMYVKLPILFTALAENYKAAGNYQLYSNALDTLIVLKDSLYKKNSAEALAEMQTKYEVQKKENTIIQQQYDITKKNYFIYSIIGILAATLLFGLAFFQNRKKSQALHLQAMEIEQKRKITQAVMQAEEEERKRIAGDLHDSVAQKMVVAKLNLEALANQLQLQEPGQKIYNNISTLLEESTAEVRDLSHSMMPQDFALTGLADTIKNFLDKIVSPNLHIYFNASGNFTFIEENTALMVYRVVQECVQNVLKHAQATKLHVTVNAENNELDITLEDNGIGFNINNPNLVNSNGLKNIQSRILYLNGKVDINSTPGNGTMIAFYIPLHQQ